MYALNSVRLLAGQVWSQHASLYISVSVNGHLCLPVLRACKQLVRAHVLHRHLSTATTFS